MPELTPPADCRLTRSGNRLFVRIFSWRSGKARAPRLGGRVTYASFLHDGAEVGVEEVDADGNRPHLRAAGPPGALVLDLPTRHPNVLVPVVELAYGTRV